MVDIIPRGNKYATMDWADLPLEEKMRVIHARRQQRLQDIKDRERTFREQQQYDQQWNKDNLQRGQLGMNPIQGVSESYGLGNQGVTRPQASAYGSENMFNFQSPAVSLSIPVEPPSNTQQPVTQTSSPVLGSKTQDFYPSTPQSRAEYKQMLAEQTADFDTNMVASKTNPNVTYGETRPISQAEIKQRTMDANRPWRREWNAAQVPTWAKQNHDLVRANQERFASAYPSYQYSSYGRPEDTQPASMQTKQYNMLGRLNPQNIQEENRRKASQGLINLNVPDWELERLGLGNLARQNKVSSSSSLSKETPTVSRNNSQANGLGNTMLGLSAKGTGGNENNPQNMYRTSTPVKKRDKQFGNAMFTV